jgi:putative transposase
MLAYITGTVDQELLIRNGYLVAQNQILKAQLKRRLKLSDGERANLGEIGHRLGRKALGEVRRSRCRTQSWHGTEGSSLASFDGSRARRARRRRRSTEKLRTWLFAWPRA